MTSYRPGSTEAPPARTTPYAWYVAGLLCLAQIMAIVDRYLLSVVQENLKHSLGLTDSQLGFLQGPGYALTFIFASLPLGRLTDIVSRRWLVVAGLTAWSISTMASGLATSFEGLLLARLGVGMGEAALLPCALSLITDYFSRDSVGRGLSIYSVGSSLGRACAFVGGGMALSFFTARQGMSLGGIRHLSDWQALFVSTGALGIVVALWFLLTVRDPPRHVDLKQRPSTRAALLYLWSRRKAYATLIIPFSLVTGISQLLASWAVSLCVREHHFSVGEASATIGTIGLAVGPAGHLIGGWLIDHLRRRGLHGAHPLIVAGIMANAAIFVCGFALAPVSWALFCYGVAYLTVSMVGPIGYAGIQAPTPAQYRGISSSLLLMSYMLLGIMTAPLLVGVLADHVFHSERMLGPSMAVSALIFAAITVPIAILGRKHYRQAVMDQERSPANT